MQLDPVVVFRHQTERFGAVSRSFVSGSVSISEGRPIVESPIQILARFPPKSQGSEFIQYFDSLRAGIAISAFFIQIWCIGTYPPHHNIENSLFEKMEDLEIHFEKSKNWFSLQNLLKVRGSAVILRYWSLETVHGARRTRRMKFEIWKFMDLLATFPSFCKRRESCQ